MPELLLITAGALIAPDRRVLVQRRPPRSAHGGLWEFPGGKIEPGETPEAALARELREELDIAVDPAAMVPLAFATEPTESGALVLLLYVISRWAGKPRAIVADALAWHTVDDLAQLSMPPADRPLVAALARALEARAGIEPACKDLQSSA